MTLDSKDSDIEQLRSQLQALHIGMDSSSIGSGPGDAEPDDGFPGTRLSQPCICLKFKSGDCFNFTKDFTLGEKVGRFFKGEPTSCDLLDLFD